MKMVLTVKQFTICYSSLVEAYHLVANFTQSLSGMLNVIAIGPSSESMSDEDQRLLSDNMFILPVQCQLASIGKFEKLPFKNDIKFFFYSCSIC